MIVAKQNDSSDLSRYGQFALQELYNFWNVFVYKSFRRRQHGGAYLLDKKVTKI